MLAGSAEGEGSPLVVFAGGGTGGHLYPALAVADALRRRVPEMRFLFFGTQRRIDQQILTGAGFKMVQQSIVPPVDLRPWRWPRIYIGFRRAGRLCGTIFEADRPVGVIGTGGFASVPALRVAARSGILTALLNPDAVPGRANRFLARSVDVIFTQWPETTQYLPRSAQVLVSGCPVRPEFNNPVRARGLERFGLDVGRKTLLVTGASQGARTINEAVLANLELLESHADWQVLHLTGERDYAEVHEAYGRRPLRATVLVFTEYMADALAAADLVIARAGASFLAEVTAMGRAAILMPYPFHRDRHQFANARCLVRASAARIVPDQADAAVNGAALREVLSPLLGDDGAREAMAGAARRMGRGNAAAEIAERVLAMSAARSADEERESLKAMC